MIFITQKALNLVIILKVLVIAYINQLFIIKKQKELN